MNGFEKGLADQLKSLGCSFDFEATRLWYHPPVVKRRYTPDFTIHREGKDPIHIEAKGYFRLDAQQKMKAVKMDYPDLDIRMVFQYDGKIQGRKSMRCSQWAEKYGFPYAIADIPKEWFD
jgi:hypothetical protein